MSATVTRLCKGMCWYNGGPSNLTVVLSRGCVYPAPVTYKIGNIARWQPESKYHGRWSTRIIGGCGEIRERKPTAAAATGEPSSLFVRLRQPRPTRN